jgi:putative aminopeptidase FrvX
VRAPVQSAIVPVPDLLARLLTAPGPSGQETLAAEVWRDGARSFGEVETDVLGSSWVRVPGTGGGPTLAVIGHIDEIGIVVTHAGDDGLVAVRPLGGWDPHVLLGQRVEVLTRTGRIPGIVAARTPKRRRGEERKPLEHSDLVLDIGAKDGSEARTLVRTGDCAVIASAPLELPNGRLAARSLDNRIGCYVALEVARRVAESGGAPGDVVGLAVVQEEVGDFAGSRTTAFVVEPDLAIAVDVTYATDVRGGDPEEEGEHKLGSGPTLARGPSLHPEVFELLYETAEAEKIACTVEASRGHTNTDADAVYLSRRGVATGLVSVPLRYMHSPVELVQLDDIEAAITLLVAFAGRLSHERPALGPR